MTVVFNIHNIHVQIPSAARLHILKLKVIPYNVLFPGHYKSILESKKALKVVNGINISCCNAILAVFFKTFFYRLAIGSKHILLEMLSIGA